jgi:hypothetical protein
MMNTDKLIDAFVAKINSGTREPGLEDEIPNSIRTGITNEYGAFDWHIKPYSVNWVAEVEKKIYGPFPRSFKSLISRYIFPTFELGPILFLANTPEGLAFSLHELRTGIFKDKVLSEALRQNSYIQFGRQAGGCYDPICFAAQRSSQSNEYPIVQIDHEGILIKSKIIIVKEIAESFVDFIEKYLKAA